MTDNDKKGKRKVNLSMAGSNYPAWINPADEEIVREAAKLVDQKVRKLRQDYPSNISKEQILCMIAYDFALKTLRYKDRNETKPYADKITELTSMLEEHLTEE